MKFSLDEKTPKMHLCGCKLSTSKPFCDGDTCKRILGGEKFVAAEAAMENAAQISTEAFTEAGHEVGN